MSKFNELFNEFINSMRISECGISYNKGDLENYVVNLEEANLLAEERIKKAEGESKRSDDDRAGTHSNPGAAER